MNDVMSNGSTADFIAQAHVALDTFARIRLAIGNTPPFEAEQGSDAAWAHRTFEAIVSWVAAYAEVNPLGALIIQAELCGGADLLA